MKDLSVLYIIYSVNLKFTVETFVTFGMEND